MDLFVRDSRFNNYIQGFLGLGAGVTIDIKLKGVETRKSHVVHTEKGPQKIPIYTGDEPVSGTVSLTLPSGKKVEHEGIKLELVGEIGTWSTRLFIYLTSK